MASFSATTLDKRLGPSSPLNLPRTGSVPLSLPLSSTVIPDRSTSTTIALDEQPRPASVTASNTGPLSESVASASLTSNSFSSLPNLVEAQSSGNDFNHRLKLAKDEPSANDQTYYDAAATQATSPPGNKRNLAGLDPLQVAAQELRDSPLPGMFETNESPVGYETTLTGGGLVLHVDLSADGTLATVTKATATTGSPIDDRLGQILFQPNATVDSLCESHSVMIDEDFTFLIGDQHSSAALSTENMLDSSNQTLESSSTLSFQHHPHHSYNNTLTSAMAAAGVTPDPPFPLDVSIASMPHQSVSPATVSVSSSPVKSRATTSRFAGNMQHLSYLLSTKSPNPALFQSPHHHSSPQPFTPHLKSARLDHDSESVFTFSNL